MYPLIQLAAGARYPRAVVSHGVGGQAALEPSCRPDHHAIQGEPLRRQGWRLKGWSHAKVLFSYTPGQSFLFVDPAKDRGDDPDCLEYFGLSEQLEKPFLRQWRNVLRIYIEVG